MNLEATAAKELTRLQKARIMQMQRIMNQTAIDVARQIRLYKLKYTGDRVTRFWEFNKPLKQSVESIFGDLNKAAKNIVEAGINDGWDLANVKNNMLADAYGKKVSIPGKMTALFRQPNLFALDAFLTRTEQGMNLSRRIWQYSKVAQDQLELYLASGITQGKSAAKLAKDVKVLLNEPNRLFRRVRDAKGNLHLSKAAAQYHPGTGVYRSSYKNAMRLTRTETNMAYHRSDFMRRQQLPFVIGIEVRLSASHPAPDICDAMQGQYPKGFLFTGWHAQCICNSISILADDRQFRNFLQTGHMDQRLGVRSIPPKAMRYVEAHKPQIDAMKNKPYWFMDNFTNDFKLRKVINTKAPVYAQAAPGKAA